MHDSKSLGYFIQTDLLFTRNTKIFISLDLYATCKSKKACYRLLSHQKKIEKHSAKHSRANKMDEIEVRTRKIKVDQEKMKYINFACNEEITCREKGSFG